MSMPFQWPPDYRPAVASPADLAGAALWFVFRRNDLLVVEPARLPRCANPSDLNLPAFRTQYLGMLANEHCFAAEVGVGLEAPPGFAWLGLRSLFGMLDDATFALAGRALQIIDWDRSHQFCGACGVATVAHNRERSRKCPACDLVTYPRIAPAIMALVRRGPDMLLARSPRFPKDMFSALAGFVEPGETLEQCLRREVEEEVGMRVGNIRYFASQPWPFPHSLMIAFFADHESGEIRIDGVEIEEAKWFGIGNLPRLPAKISIARRLIDAAMGGCLPRS